MRHRLRLGLVALAMMTAREAEANSFDDATLVNDVVFLTKSPEIENLFSPAELQELSVLLNGLPQSLDGLSHFLVERAPIEVDINPEARVSVKRTAAALRMPQCAAPAFWLARIENQGQVTSRLNAELAGHAASRLADVRLVGPRLRGATTEYRVLRVTLRQATQSDIVIAFNTGPTTIDLVSRGELPLLLQCGMPPTMGEPSPIQHMHR